MTKEELLKELKRINVKIDRLINQGKPYAKEAAEHKRIIRALSH